jgi:hypothetical protein
VQDNTGKEYIYDENPGKTVATTFAQRYVYKTVGRIIYVSPGSQERIDPTTINVHLVTEDNVWNYLFDQHQQKRSIAECESAMLCAHSLHRQERSRRWRT